MPVVTVGIQMRAANLRSDLTTECGGAGTGCAKNVNSMGQVTTFSFASAALPVTVSG